MSNFDPSTTGPIGSFLPTEINFGETSTTGFIAKSSSVGISFVCDGEDVLSFNSETKEVNFHGRTPEEAVRLAFVIMDQAVFKNQTQA